MTLSIPRSHRLASTVMAVALVALTLTPAARAGAMTQAPSRCAGREVHPRMIRLIGSAFTLTKAIHTMSMSIMHDIGATITSVVGKARRERAYAW